MTSWLGAVSTSATRALKLSCASALVVAPMASMTGGEYGELPELCSVSPAVATRSTIIYVGTEPLWEALLDDNRNNLLGPEELEIFLHHMGNLSNYSTFSKSVYEDSWTVEDFSSLCLAALTKHGEQRFGILLKGLIDTRTDEHLVEKIAWQRLGVRVDGICQRIFPIAYALCLVALFSFELPDP